ncbi:glycosyltransferase family 1 protein [Lyngbya confervoides]|uniref:Glycosyltransferase n=1 Tax=Lyngbya confervoides BDU141951 TaxID=1574623 RepID=A0ABD4SZL5_9CYAN|nr:glycosyltransferase family 1 protein [Lyngbya confervoides]MCM1981754.1 hypothetical protein [Lyngbya confervoides BDU141951]
MLNLFYEEPDPDRWLPGDRYPRRVIRKVLRPNPRISGQQRVFLNLLAGLDQLNIPYRVNDFRYIQRHRDEVACIVGKPNVLEKLPWKNPILFGAAVFSHPCDQPPDFLALPIRRMLVPGEWMAQMWRPYYGERVYPWPVGIDTDLWCPVAESEKEIDFLLYDKIRWDHDAYEVSLLNPMRCELEQRGHRVVTLRYGHYEEAEFHQLLQRCRAMIFLCEHETQGIAYQQALSCNVPILAWDRGGAWQDPNYYPHRVDHAPVSSVPYWDHRCGLKFETSEQFSQALSDFWHQLSVFSPRDYILEHLTLAHCAQDYLNHVHALEAMG